MDPAKFDLILDASDENFVSKLKLALGVKPGDVVNLITPQFTRTDGRLVSYLPNTPEEYEAIKSLDGPTLKKIGCQVWNEEGGRTHWLYPSEWYAHIPAGTEIVDINGETEKFEPGVTDDDIRFGALAYGFIQQAH